MESTQRYDIELVEGLARSFCRRYRLDPDDCDDFRQEVHLKLLENDSGRLRQFRGQSSFKTFQHVVVKRLALDFLIRKTGKWHTSAIANQLGAVAVQLEILMYREHNTRDQAIQILLSRSEFRVSEQTLQAIAARLPARSFGNREDESDPDGFATSERADQSVLTEESARDLERHKEALRRALGQLDPEDRLILQMRYWSGFTIVQIGKVLGIPKRPHDRVSRILRQLRAILASDGVDPETLRGLLNEPLW